MDPIITPLLLVVLGNVAHELITEACKDYLKDKLKSVFGWLEKLGEGDKVEHAYRDAMEQAFAACLEMLLSSIKSHGYTEEELKEYQPSIKLFIKDKKVAEELLNAIREPGRNDLPSPDVLRERWRAIGGQELPSDDIWNTVVKAFRRQATKRVILSDSLREILNAQNIQELKELIERQGGVKVQVRRDKYSQRMRTKFSPVDLANLMPAYADDPGRMVIRDVFVAPHVRENPPAVELPKDLAEKINKGFRDGLDGETMADLDEKQLETVRLTYVNQSPRPVLDVIASPPRRLMVLTGDPGSGKSTLMRYLLTGVIEPPIDPKTGQPLSWTLTFKESFSLLIELRDFYFLRQRGKCDTFLEYVAYMGNTDQWFLDDHAVHDFLENGHSLVMFDGLDEIFESGDRERVMQEIAGFAQRYTRAKIIVTSRPVGYKEQILREAGFEHFGIQDLDDDQIEAFIRGWFALTFPQQPQQAAQRIERVLGSVGQSKPIRLLAGNPMLLTIMVLLAREEELPRERAKFYEKAVEVLCHHWDVNRNLGLPEDKYLNADDKKTLLRRIAMQMQAGDVGLKGNVIEEDDLVDEIHGFLMDEQWQTNAGEAKKAARRMIQQLRERNYILCLRGPCLYGFVHRTFLEYLTAAEYVRRFDRQPQQMTIDDLLGLFDKHCRDDEWREVLRLICGQIDEQFVGQIIDQLLTRVDKWQSNKTLPELPLTIYALEEVRNPTRLEESGRKLMKKVIDVAYKTADGYGGRIHNFLMNDLLRACREIGTRWPGHEELSEVALSTVGKLPVWLNGEWFWPHLVAYVTADRKLVTEISSTTKGTDGGRFYRAEALSALAEKWPDERTRTLLTERAVQDEQSNPRSAALRALGEKWPDNTTRDFLTERAVKDENSEPRSTALQTLANRWPDEATRALLTARASQDEQTQPRSTALQTLGNWWPDNTTRTLLMESLKDPEADIRRTAIQTLADKWPDNTTRTLLTGRLEDYHLLNRRTALQILAEKWPDETTRTHVTERVLKDEESYVRSAAIETLAEKWADDATRTLIIERATQDEGEDARGTALRTLGTNWADGETRALLTQCAVHDTSPHVRRTALEILAKAWSDDVTRALITERVVQDEDSSLRISILRILSTRWPDDATNKLLAERATQDPDENVRSTVKQMLY